MKIPFPVIFLGALFILAGLVGLAYHLSDRPLDGSYLLVAALRLLAVFGGLFLLLGRGWARWLLIAWLALHVAVSALHSVTQTLAHAALLVAVAYVLLRPPASRYFQTR